MESFEIWREYLENKRVASLSEWHVLLSVGVFAIIGVTSPNYNWCDIFGFSVLYQTYTPIIYHSNGKWTLWRCNSYQTWGYSIAMLVYRSVYLIFQSIQKGKGVKGFPKVCQVITYQSQMSKLQMFRFNSTSSRGAMIEATLTDDLPVSRSTKNNTFIHLWVSI